MKKKFICLVIAISLLSTSCMQTVLAMDTQTPVSENENSENLEEGNESSDNLEKENDNTEQETTADISDNSSQTETPVKNNNLKTADSTDPAGPSSEPSEDKPSVTLSEPVLVSAENYAKGIKITWKSVTNASGYRIYRKSASTDWQVIGTSDETKYIDEEDHVSGNTYTYTVQAYTGTYEEAIAQEGNKDYWSSYNTTGISEFYLDIPSLLSVKNATTGVTVKWSKVNGATSYRVYRKASGSDADWKLLKTVSSTSYTDKSSLTKGIKYLYTVKACKGSDRSYFDTNGISTIKLSTPSLTKAENASGGIKVTWKSVKGAEGYRIYRKTSGSSWVRLATLSSTSYTDKSSLKNNTKYYYTVRAYNGADLSSYNTKGVSETRLDIPALSKAENASGGIKISWKSVKGATSYRVYRKTAGAEWKHIKTVSSTSYTDGSSLTSGKEYIYTVRACKGSDRSYYDTKGVIETKLAIPSLSSAENVPDGIKITWKSVKGAEGYRIYRRTSGSDWTKLATLSSSSLTYTDEGSFKNNIKYYYTVRAYKGSDWGYFHRTGVSQTKLDIPSLTEAKNSSGGIKVTWKSVKGATSYRVYRKTSGSSWKHIKTVSSTSYTDGSSLTSGKEYIYTVRACKGSDRSYYDTKGVIETKLAIPSLSSAENVPDGIKITWKSVKGAEGYRIYRRTSGSDWTKLATLSSSSLTYTDEGSFKNNIKYYYTVRAYKGSDWGYFHRTGVSQTKLDIPSLTEAKNSSGGIKVTWKSVKGATSYRVYRKTSGSSWKHIKTVSSTSYTDGSSLTSGKEYTYTVRACKGSDRSYFDSKGVKELKLSTPTLVSAKKSSSGIKITWKSVKGAEGYRVYRKTSGSSWTRIATTASTSYTDKKAKSSNYIYTVRAYRGSDLSWYNSSGVTLNKMLAKAQGYSSSTKWLILVDTKSNKVGIYNGSKGKWVEKKYWSCTSGARSTPTPKGTYTVKAKGLAFGHGYTCWYYTQFYGDYLFHSVLYNPGSKTKIQDGRLGINASHGCIRLTLTNAKWIYDNIPRGTKVVIY